MSHAESTAAIQQFLARAQLSQPCISAFAANAVATATANSRRKPPASCVMGRSNLQQQQPRTKDHIESAKLVSGFSKVAMVQPVH